MRTRAVRLLPAQVAAVGDQVAPEVVPRALRRLYELTVGLEMASSAGACSSRPDRKLARVRVGVRVRVRLANPNLTLTQP